MSLKLAEKLNGVIYLILCNLIRRRKLSSLFSINRVNLEIFRIHFSDLIIESKF